VWKNPYCQSYDKNNNCLTCSKGYVLNGNFCIINSTICKIFNSTTKLCTSCDPSFVISGKSCVAQVTINPFCLTFNGTKCVSCAPGYFPNSGTCSYPSSECAIANQITGNCLACNSRYFLINGRCLPVSPLCNSYSSIGLCTTCFTGYTVKKGACVNLTSVDPFCLNFQGSMCVNCQNRYYIGLDGICVPINNLCQTYVINTGVCITCISGYSKTSGGCASWASLNPQCLTFDLNGKCTNCTNRYFIGLNSICTKVNALCQTYSMTSGYCLSCYSEYSLYNGICISSTIINPKCLNFDTFGSCTNCSNGYFIGIETICSKVSVLC
jgi:hypothetical protein